MKLFQLSIVFLLSLITSNTILCHSDEPHKKSHQSSSRTFFTKNCEQLMQEVDSLDQEVFEEKEVMGDLEVRSINPLKLFLLVMIASGIVPIAGLSMMAVAGTSGLYHVFKDGRVAKLKSHIALMEEKKLSILKECKNRGCFKE